MTNVHGHRACGHFVPDECLHLVDDHLVLRVRLHVDVDVLLDHRGHEVGQHCDPHVVPNGLLEVAFNFLQHLFPLADRTFR